MNEKDMQLLYEQKFLENINKEYSDKEYERDINECLKDKKEIYEREFSYYVPKRLLLFIFSSS